MVRQFVLAWLLCLSGQSLAQACDVTPGSLDPADRPPIRLALLVGIGDYPTKLNGIRKLTGPRNDIAAMTELLAGKFAFAQENIRILVDRDATRQAILDAFCHHLVGRGRAGDAVLFYYSGHGSRMGDLPPFDEPDGYDETIVPVDSRIGDVQDIRDDEIRDLIDRLATDNVTLVMDSCYSGTGARNIAVARVTEPDPRFPPRRTAARAVEAANGFSVRGGRFVLITGARAEQESFEQPFTEGVHGVMTYFLVRALREARSGATYRDVFETMAARIAADFPRQAPQLEGTNSDNQLFLDTRVVLPHYVDAAPSGDGVVLRAGAIHGVTEDSRYAVFPPATHDFALAHAIAEIEVTSVDAFSARARVLSGRVREAASRAIETLHNYREQKVQVSTDIPDVAIAAVLAALGDAHNIGFVRSPAGGDLAFSRVVPQSEAPDPELALLFPDGTQASPGLRLSQPDFAQRLARQLQAWSRWFGVLRLHNPAPNFEAAVELIGLGGQRVGSEGSEAGRLLLEAGDGFIIRVQNKSRRRLFVHVIDLASDGSITAIFPEPGSATAIASGHIWQDIYTARIPAGHAVVRDIVKVILSTEEINIAGLLQPGAKSMARNPMEELFDRFAGARHIGRRDLKDWITLERSLVVRKKD